MRALFLRAAEKISAGDRLLHWELLVDDECSNILSAPSIHESTASRAKYSITNKSFEELTAEDTERASRGNQLPSVQESSNGRDGRNSTVNNSPGKSSDKISLIQHADAVIRSYDLTTPNTALDIIIDATYSM
ncbi:uncharacterized protein LOC112589629 [Harpegnathos saltator]|uniref:uncharacterized protein LOC112589629 n=1 Tax=Harpegnathos saltator TaxID=610380 RepID=UPI000DBEE34F|nr:uncharacterized protein LOC112589629 [Harpegnathos saltator]